MTRDNPALVRVGHGLAAVTATRDSDEPAPIERSRQAAGVTRSPVRKGNAMAPIGASPAASPVEMELTRLQAKLDKLKAEVRQAQQLAALGTAAAMMAHEFSNWLTPVLNYAREAAKTDDIELMRKALSRTVSNVTVATRFSDRILELTAAKPAERVPTSIASAAQLAVESLGRDLSKDGIRFSSQLDPSLRVLADPLGLQQVLFNLFLNARDAMAGRKSSRLTVSAQVTNGRTRIQVRDNGPGIALEVQRHLFEAFETSKHVLRGGRIRCGGLGLAICRQIAEDNGGTIAVESNEDDGTTFTIELDTA